MGFFSEALQSIGMDCWSYFLLGIGSLLVISQIAVHRRKNLYVGLLGLGLILTAVSRAIAPDGTTAWVLTGAQVLCYGYAVVLMVMHSSSNMRKLREKGSEREKRLLEELQEIADQAREEKAADGLAGNEPESDDDSSGDDRKEPR